MNDKSPSEQIDDIIKQYGGWKADVIKSLRATINEANPSIVEVIKWKMKNRPEGLPVWTHNGIVCFIETWKDNIKLIFPKGVELSDPNKLFNARLNSTSIRAIEIHEGDSLDISGIKVLTVEAVRVNDRKVSNKT